MAAASHTPYLPSNGQGEGLFITVLVFSLFLHMAAITGFFFYSEFYAAKAAPRVRPEVYVVHLIDPGPLTGRFELGRSAVVDASPAPTAPAVKSVAPPSKLEIPVSKEAAAEVKKVAVPDKKRMETKEAAGKIDKKAPPLKQAVAEEKRTAPLKQKKPVTEVRDTEAAAREIRERKGGGSIDIRKFPYEWYLRIMESRIYGNWDTFRANYFTNRTARVTVFFSIDRNGNMTEAKVEHSSLNDEIDKSALAAVRGSAPFPPLPPGYKEKSLEVHFGFVLEPPR